MADTNPITNFFGGTITQPYNPPQEYGVDVGLPVGTVVRLPVTGTYRPDLSTTYNSVFAVPSSSGTTYEDLLHITPFPPLSAGQVVQAGSPIGFVSPTTGSNLYFPDISTSKLVGPFSSTGPHVELGYYTDPNQALYGGGSSSINPAQLFSQDQSSGFVSGYNPQTTYPASSGIIPPPTTPDSGSTTVGSPTGTTIHISNPFADFTDFIKRIPTDIGQRLGFILVALALIIVGGLVVGRSFR